MSFQLFPYATTSRWKIWKQRVFDCSTLKGEQAAHLALPIALTTERGDQLRASTMAGRASAPVFNSS